MADTLTVTTSTRKATIVAIFNSGSTRNWNPEFAHKNWIGMNGLVYQRRDFGITLWSSMPTPFSSLWSKRNGDATRDDKPQRWTQTDAPIASWKCYRKMNRGGIPSPQFLQFGKQRLNLDREVKRPLDCVKRKQNEKLNEACTQKFVEAAWLNGRRVAPGLKSMEHRHHERNKKTS